MDAHYRRENTRRGKNLARTFRASFTPITTTRPYEPVSDNDASNASRNPPEKKTGERHSGDETSAPPVNLDDVVRYGHPA